jgi:UDPglucose 6-dehydrogenase
MARVLVVGAGVVGSATGRGLSRLGHAVTFCDIDRTVIETLRAEGFDVGERIDLMGPPTFIFLCVPTPSNSGGYDLGAIRAATAMVGGALRDASEFHTVAVRSTVPPGTCDQVVVPLIEDVSGKREGEHFSVASNPEFLRAMSADEDFRFPWMTVIGSRSGRTVERLLDILRPFGGEFRTFPSTVEAEFVKCAHNLYNATKISFWNELWRVAQNVGIECDAVAGTVARSAEGSFNVEYGIRGGAPFGGACLPKDARGFLEFARHRGVHMPILEGVLQLNRIMESTLNRRLDAGLDSLVELAE